MQPVPLADDVVELLSPTDDDVDAITALCQDADIRRWTTVPSPYVRADAEVFVSTLVADGWAADRSCTWGIRTGGSLVGMVGLRVQPVRSAEVGYWLGPQARGRGLLHRSLRLALDWAFDPDGLDLDRVEWHCVAGNWPSWRAAWRVGFTFEGVVRGGALGRGRRHDDWVGTLLRDDPREPVAPWPATTVAAPRPAVGDPRTPAPSPAAPRGPSPSGSAPRPSG